jgi:type IV fimbrial biogenesis protein FimT
MVVMGSTSFRYITNSNRVAAEVNGLLGDMQLARMEAIKQGVPVTICTSTNGTGCAGTTTWQGGWIVFTDFNGDGAVTAGADAVLRLQPTFANADTFVSSNNANLVTFNREGFATGIAGGTLISLHDSSSNPNWTRCLQVNRSGMLVTQKGGETVNTVACS